MGSGCFNGPMHISVEENLAFLSIHHFLRRINELVVSFFKEFAFQDCHFLVAVGELCFELSFLLP